jgi:ParB family chromosome partitioning protein
MGKGLFEKAGRIQMPQPKVADTEVSPAESTVVPLAAKPKTAPGTLMGFMATQSEAIKDNEVLRERLSRFDGASPSRLLDPKLIAPSKWANRHPSSFLSVEFQNFKVEIAQAGGNVQPIKVRQVVTSEEGNSDGGVGPSYPSVAMTSGEGVGPSYPPPSPHYEIIFGHRRHRACLELGLPVLAVIEDATEQELFVQMERENRNRADLSAWEQGVMYARALDSGLYPSNRRLADAIGRDLSDVGRALSLARLPQGVIDAFRSPLDLQFRWAKPLSDAQQRDPDLLMTRAKALRGTALVPKEILAALVDEPSRSSGPSVVTLERNGAVVATVTTSKSGQVSIKVHTSVDGSLRDKLIKAVDRLL